MTESTETNVIVSLFTQTSTARELVNCTRKDKVRNVQYRIAICDVNLQPLRCIPVLVLLKMPYMLKYPVLCIEELLYKLHTNTNYCYTNLVLWSKKCDAICPPTFRTLKHNYYLHQWRLTWLRRLEVISRSLRSFPINDLDVPCWSRTSVVIFSKPAETWHLEEAWIVLILWTCVLTGHCVKIKPLGLACVICLHIQSEQCWVYRKILYHPPIGLQIDKGRDCKGTSKSIFKKLP